MAEKKAAEKKEAKKVSGTKAGAKDIGLDVLNPPTGDCSDNRCPFHGSLKVRGRIFEGTVRSDKMQGSVVVEWDYVVPVRKYQRYMRRKSRVVAHRPPCVSARHGDVVRIAECRGLSKTKSFVVLEALAAKK